MNLTVGVLVEHALSDPHISLIGRFKCSLGSRARGRP
jgi:hypothetical protein